MYCADYKRWFSPYIDEQLEPQQRRQFEQHLGKCAGCSSNLASLQEMLRSLRALEPPEVPELLPGIQARLALEPWWQRLARRFVAPWPASLPLHGAALATAALLVIVVVGLPHFLQAPRTSLMQLASKSSDEIGDQFGRQDYEPYYQTVGNDTASRRQIATREVSTGERIEADDKAVLPAAGAPFEVEIAEVLKLEQEASKPVPEEALAISEEAAETVSLSIAGGGGDAVVGVPGVPGSATGAAATCPSCEKKRAELASQWEEHLQVQWRVNDLASAAAQLNGWVQSKGGSVIAIDEHRLSVTLPEAAVSEFLTQFSSGVSGPATISLDTSPDSTQWVTISLELVPSE